MLNANRTRLLAPVARRARASLALAHAAIVLAAIAPPSSGLADDWPQFRGPNGQGKAPAAEIPIRWNSNENLAWRSSLPGRGSSSPIVVDGNVYLTAYTGYGLDPAIPGERDDLRLHLLCYSLADGQQRFNTALEPHPAEQEVTPRIADHGYASPTPVSDGKRIFAFFGPSGLAAFDMQGELLWRRNLGTKTAGFGAAASPILFDDLVIMNASIESDTLYALDVKTGKTVWERKEITRAWTTPTIVPLKDGPPELVISQKGTIFGLDPRTGKELWQCYGIQDYVVPVVLHHEGIVYCSAGRQNRTIAIRAGGRGDVTDTHVVWEANYGANVTSPVYHDGYLYWAHDKSLALCLDAETGKRIYRDRLPTRMRVYGSIICADEHLFLTTRDAGVLVMPAEPKLNVIATNRLGEKEERFNATPAVADDAIVLRSDRALYCVRHDD